MPATCLAPKAQYTYVGNTALPLTETIVDGVAGTSSTTTHSYDAAGRLLSSDGPLTGTDDAVYNRYDPLGRKTWEIGPKGANGLRTAKRTAYRDSDDKPTLTTRRAAGAWHQGKILRTRHRSNPSCRNQGDR